MSAADPTNPPQAPITASSATELADGESREMKGSGSKPYVLKNTGGVYSCTCPSWLHQSFAIERRTCKHLKALRGEEAEKLRVGGPLARAIAAAAASGSSLGGLTTSGSAAATSTSGSTPLVMTAANGAPLLLLAHRWESHIDPTGWWLSEKLDGVRAFWNGKNLLSRLGNTLWAPDWFLEALPADMPLDGELFGGRKKFQETVSIVRRQDKSNAWKSISFVIFDAPKVDATFEGRLSAVADFVAEKPRDHLRAHPHLVCKGLAHLSEELARVEALGGEGLMMRKAGSRYESGRSMTLLKVKTFHDAEAIVVGYKPGEGRHLGRMGALECDLPNGKHFSVGSGFTDLQREKPPPLGTVITFRYQELSTDGIPRFPTFVGIRNDVSWPPSGSKGAPLPLELPSATGSTSSLHRPGAASASPAPRESAAIPPAAPKASVEPPSVALTRVFTKDGISWEITLTAQNHTVRRRRGFAVKMTTTTLPSPAEVWRDANALIDEQIANGWTEVLES